MILHSWRYGFSSHFAASSRKGRFRPSSNSFILFVPRVARDAKIRESFLGARPGMLTRSGGIADRRFDSLARRREQAIGQARRKQDQKASRCLKTPAQGIQIGSVSRQATPCRAHTRTPRKWRLRQGAFPPPVRHRYGSPRRSTSPLVPDRRTLPPQSAFDPPHGQRSNTAECPPAVWRGGARQQAVAVINPKSLRSGSRRGGW
jgi:hypothetical protein